MINLKIEIKTVKTNSGPATIVECTSYPEDPQPGEINMLHHVAAAITVALEKFAPADGRSEIVSGTMSSAGTQAQIKAMKQRNGIKT